MMILAVTQSIFKLGPPNYDDDDDDINNDDNGKKMPMELQTLGLVEL